MVMLTRMLPLTMVTPLQQLVQHSNTSLHYNPLQSYLLRFIYFQILIPTS